MAVKEAACRIVCLCRESDAWRAVPSLRGRDLLRARTEPFCACGCGLDPARARGRLRAARPAVDARVGADAGELTHACFTGSQVVLGPMTVAILATLASSPADSVLWNGLFAVALWLVAVAVLWAESR